jgi:hypothetical protein
MRMQVLQGGQQAPVRVGDGPPEGQAFSGDHDGLWTRGLPHDLAQFVVEGILGLQHGFWGLLANGATFKSVPGRRRTKPGQQVIRGYREALTPPSIS